MDFQTASMRRNNALRNLTNYFVSGLSVLATILVIIPLIAILFYLVYKGASSLNFAFFTKPPAPVGEQGGGMANAIVGSGIILALASLMGIPIGIAAGVYLAEFGRGKQPWGAWMCGDKTNKPNANLGPIVKAPFYAVELSRMGGTAFCCRTAS